MRNASSGASVLDGGPRRRDNASHGVGRRNDGSLDNGRTSWAVLNILGAASHSNDGSAVVEHGRRNSDRG